MQHPHQQYGGNPQQNTSPGGQQPHHGFAPAAEGEPEYFGSAASTPTYDNNPGHTRAFSIGDAPDEAYDPYEPQSPQPDQVSTYRAGHTTAPPAGPGSAGSRC